MCFTGEPKNQNDFLWRCKIIDGFGKKNIFIKINL
jgi:hypothetical protein